LVAQNIWVGIATAVFLAGLGIGYALFGAVYAGSNPKLSTNETPVPVATEVTTDVLDSGVTVQTPAELAEAAAQDELVMKILLNSTKFQSMLIEHMKENHQLTQTTIVAMMDDPELRGQLLGHMWDNKEFLNEVRNLLEQESAPNEDDHGMMQ
jgi:hypothetical protein